TEAGKRRLIEKEKVPGEKIIVVHNGIEKSALFPGTDPEKLKKELALPQDGIFLFHAGHFLKKKAQVNLIRSFPPVAEKFSRVHLLIAGDGPLKKALEKEISLSPCAGRIHLLGFRKNIFDIFSISRLFLLSSLWEGMPNVILEAMLSGVPVVATGVGGVTEIIEDGINGILVQPDDIVSLSQKVIWALENPELMKTFAEKAKEKVLQEFSLDQMVEKLENFYLRNSGQGS
ncbi:MAG: glycosyltransferase family 4 protein, partial [Candidatus Aureabacteria bacterium]|nr:glycosyltransferase family 4 protein [Candidatus Auribacterota bacterium]